MVNRDVIAAKLADLQRRTARVREHVPPTCEGLAASPDSLDLVSFNLMLAIQICADVASHIIADEGWQSARTLRESFIRLRDHGVLTPATSDALARAAGLRNVVAHGYADVEVALVHEAATRGVEDLEAFAREVAGFALSDA